MTNKSEMKAVTDEQIKHMANRFLGWRLPESFNPDHGISFKNPYPHLPQHWPSGTNLFDAEQAEVMVRYMAEGLPSSRPPADQVPAGIKTADQLKAVIEKWLFADDPSHWGRFEKALDAALKASGEE